MGARDDGWLQQLLAGINSNWATGKLKYHIRHFMASWGMMSSAEKNSPMFKIFMCYTSDAMFKMPCCRARPTACAATWCSSA